MKHRKGWRNKGIRWEYDGDGRFTPERIKGFWKRFWRKWRSRMKGKLDD